jgi:flagellar hook assembly protein FlgD
MKVKLTLMSMAILTVCASLTYAGTAGYEFVRSEDPVILGIDVADVSYDFVGNAEVPFTLSGTQATVYLAIYNLGGADSPGGYGGPGRPEWNGGHALLRAEGIPNMVKVVDCGQYDVGPGTCLWDGTDWDGQDVEPGTYRLYVLGYDNITDANWIAVTGAGFRNRTSTVKVMNGQGYMHTSPNKIGKENEGPRNDYTYGMGGAFTLYPLPPGNWLEVDDPWDMMAPFTAELPEYDLGLNDDGNPIRVLGGSAHGVAIDPEDFSRNWMFGYNGVGAIGVSVDWDSQTSEPMAGFGEPPASWQAQIALGDNINFFHSIQYWDGFLYMGNGWLNDPPAAGIYELDSGTGEVTDIIDVSEWMVREQYGHDAEVTESTLAASMINCIGIDESGFVMSAGGWGPSSLNQVPLKVDWNGDLVYQNGTGDGFNDNIWAGEAAALGVESVTDGESHAVSISRGDIPGFSFMTEASKGDMARQPAYGAVYGPDGAGIFHAQGPNIPLTNHEATGSGTNMIHEQSDWDGLYILVAEKAVGEEVGFVERTGGHQVAHWPFRISQAWIGDEPMTAVTEVPSDVTPQELELGDAYPNPFNPATTIEFAVPTEGHATVTVLNTQGQVVNTLVNEFVSTGTYRTTWDGMNANGELAAGGLYFYRLQIGGQEVTKKMTFLK